MIYTTSDWKRMKHMDPDKPVWGFMFEPSQTKSSKPSAHCKPVRGMITYEDNLKDEIAIRHLPDNVRKTKFCHGCTYFVPFKKNAKTCDITELAWSKAVYEYYRNFADTEAEAIDAYNHAVQEQLDIFKTFVKETEQYLIQ